MNTAIYWDKTLFTLTREGWSRQAPVLPHEVALGLMDKFGAKQRVRLVFQPENLLTEMLMDAPAPSSDARQAVQANFAEGRPALASDALAWSFQTPWSAGASFNTHLHMEEQPGFTGLLATAAASGLRVEAAYPFLSLFAEEKFVAGRAMAYVVIAESKIFFFGISADGRQHVDNQVGVDVWNALAHLLATLNIKWGDDDAGHIAASVQIYRFETSPAVDEVCLYWGDLRKKHKVEVANWEKLVERLARLPTRHPSNFLAGFPAPIALTGALQVTAGVALLATLMAGYACYSNGQSCAREIGELKAALVQLQTTGRHNEENGKSAENLNALLASTEAGRAAGRAELLANLSTLARQSDTWTLDELTVSEAGEVKITGALWAADSKAPASAKMLTDFVNSLKRLRPEFTADQNKTTLEATTGRFVVVGKLARESS